MSTKILLPLITMALAGSLALAQGRAGLVERPLPDGAGKAAIEGTCADCHAMALVTNTGHTPQDWKLLVERMVNVGARIPEDQMKTVGDYLASKGVDKSKIQAVGMGEKQPVVQCDQKNMKELIACLQPNRRVEVEVKGETKK